MKIKFETEKKEKEIFIKQNEVNDLINQKQRIWLLVGGLFSALIISLLTFFKIRDEAQRKLQVQKMEEALIISKLKNKELETQKLQNELENRQQDLTNLAIDISRKNEFSNQLINKLDDWKNAKKNESQSKLKELTLYVSNHLRINEDLALLQKNVESINQAFYQRLNSKFENLTSNDKYMLGLIRLNLSNKDLAMIKGISAGSAKVMRYRLRKKLELTPEVDFAKFLQNL